MNAVPFYAQERAESCVPACVRMILAHHDIVRTESEIYNCCETDPDGTLPSAAVRCVQKFGLHATSERLKDGFESLRHYCSYSEAIVFVHLAPILGIQAIHAVIVEIIDSQQGLITVIDPAFPPHGRRTWSISLFEIGWQLARNQVILVA